MTAAKSQMPRYSLTSKAEENVNNVVSVRPRVAEEQSYDGGLVFVDPVAGGRVRLLPSAMPGLRLWPFSHSKATMFEQPFDWNSQAWSVYH